MRGTPHWNIAECGMSRAAVGGRKKSIAFHAAAARGRAALRPCLTEGNTCASKSTLPIEEQLVYFENMYML